MNKYGFLRETTKSAIQVGIDKTTGLPRTGLDEYLNIIFPEVTDWLHDKSIPIEFTRGIKTRRRPDYRSETLKLIVEFDGIHHYTNPDVILKDKTSTEFYESCGYKVVRIPYFIQLTNKTVERMFGRKIEIPLFPEDVYSLTYKDRNTPAYLCPMGIQRMREVFNLYPEQYEVNKNQLLKEPVYLSGYDLI